MSNDFDQRQFRQMKSLVVRLEQRKIGVSGFVSDQWSLIEMLKETDLKWRQDYYSLVNEIEDLYASAVDQGLEQMKQQDVDPIDGLLKRMLDLLSIVLTEE